MEWKVYLEARLVLRQQCCIARDPVLWLSEFNFFFSSFFSLYDWWPTCECFACYHQELLRSNSVVNRIELQ